jgi:alpha-L-rhamnosidase
MAYSLLTRRDIPSWLHMIDQGATTVWERWDGYVEGRGFQDAGMNSFNHYAFGAVGEWMFRGILGLAPDESRPGYQRFVVRPRPGGDITWARGSYESIRGRIAVSWTLHGEDLTLVVTVPANTTAVIHVPARRDAVLTESGVPVEQAPHLKLEKRTEREAIFEAGSGEYRFAASPPEKNL